MRSQNTILLLLISLLVSSCISRLGRPAIVGVITDFDGNPIPNCTVGETVTDKNGVYRISEKRYNQFFLTEMFQMEAPPVFISEKISKEGYVSKSLELFSKYGGGSGKGTQWDMDTIRLKQEHQRFKGFSQQQWNVSANKTMDTLFFIHSNKTDLSKTNDGKSFYNEYKRYTDDYHLADGKDNLAEGIIRQYIDVSLILGDTLKAQKVVHYGNKNGGYSEQKSNDTLQTTGKWNLVGAQIHMKSAFNELNGVYEVSTFDYDYIQWVKTALN